MQRHALWLSIFLPLATGSLAQPVSDPNGRVTGNFGEVVFDLPALCERAPFVTAKTHDKTGRPAFEAALMPNGIASIEVRSEQHNRQFGAVIDALNFEALNFPLSITGDVDDIDFSFLIDCPAEFSD